MPSLVVRTNASAPETEIPYEGVLVPAAGASTVFDDTVRIMRLQGDASFLRLLTDDAYGAGASTLVIVDSGGTDVPQALAESHLALALTPIPGKSERHSSLSRYLYVGYTQTSGALESDPVWQIYRLDLLTDTVTYAAFDAGFIHRWDLREGLNYVNYYLTTVEPTIGAANILEGWSLTEPSGAFAGVKGVSDGTAGVDVTQGVASGAPQWPFSARIDYALAGTDPIVIPHPAGGELDFGSTTDFSLVFWIRGNNSAHPSGAMGKRAAAGTGPGIVVAWRTDVAPDQVQFIFYDGVGQALKAISNNAASDGAWHMWTVVHDGTAQTVRVWLDKVEQGGALSVASLGSYANTEALEIGDGPGVLQLLDGYPAHPYFTSSLLTQLQIDALYDGGQ